MKVTSKVYRGIEYIVIDDLPQQQQEKISKSISHDLLIKILIDNKVVSNCLQYKDYEYWFNHFYTPEKVKAIEAGKSPVHSHQVVLNNA